MSDLWPRIEPLLARVEKPARYIGMEQGSVRPQHEAGRVAFLLIYPDTYEIGLPNQGLQILYEILNERPDAVAERTYAPWTDLKRWWGGGGGRWFWWETPRPRGDLKIPALNWPPDPAYTNSLTATHPPGGGRLRHPRLQPVGRARLHERPELHRPRGGPGAGPRPGPVGCARGRRRSLHLQPRAARRLPRLRRHGRRGRGRVGDHRSC